MTRARFHLKEGIYRHAGFAQRYKGYALEMKWQRQGDGNNC
jgi:hypothetical protein